MVCKTQIPKDLIKSCLVNLKPGLFCLQWVGRVGWLGNHTVLTVLLPPVTPMMELKPNAGSDRAWVWNTHADFADECPKQELLAIRFLNAESKSQASLTTSALGFQGDLTAAGKHAVGSGSALLSGGLREWS